MPGMGDGDLALLKLTHWQGGHCRGKARGYHARPPAGSSSGLTVGRRCRSCEGRCHRRDGPAAAGCGDRTDGIQGRVGLRLRAGGGARQERGGRAPEVPCSPASRHCLGRGLQGARPGLDSTRRAAGWPRGGPAPPGCDVPRPQRPRSKAVRDVWGRGTAPIRTAASSSRARIALSSPAPPP